MTGEKWVIYWTEHSSDTYLYGSKIKYHKKDNVEYENKLMPPGTIIKEWYSKTNFQAKRIEPALPMIDGESKYHISYDIDVHNEGQCIIKLVFYDKYENEAGYIILRDKEQDFKCPLKTYKYSMQLINGGASHINFHSITIQEIIDEDDEQEAKKIL